MRDLEGKTGGITGAEHKYNKAVITSSHITFETKVGLQDGQKQRQGAEPSVVKATGGAQPNPGETEG